MRTPKTKSSERLFVFVVLTRFLPSGLLQLKWRNKTILSKHPQVTFLGVLPVAGEGVRAIRIVKNVLQDIGLFFYYYIFELFFAFGFDFAFDFRCRLGLGCSHQFNGNGDVGSNKRGKAKDQNDDVEQICFTIQQNCLGLLNQ